METICSNRSVKLEAFCVVHAYGELTIQSTQLFASDPRDWWSVRNSTLIILIPVKRPNFRFRFSIKYYTVFLSLAVGRMWDELAGNSKYHSPEAVGITESLLMK